MSWHATTIPALLMLLSASAAAGVTIVATRHQASSQAIGIARSGSQPSRSGPAQNFTGSVRIDPLFDAKEPSRTPSTAPSAYSIGGDMRRRFVEFQSADRELAAADRDPRNVRNRRGHAHGEGHGVHSSADLGGVRSGALDLRERRLLMEWRDAQRTGLSGEAGTEAIEGHPRAGIVSRLFAIDDLAGSPPSTISS
jgi:hypothetical protein